MNGVLPVVSPCVNICRMDKVSGLCSGCFRTLEEITVWSRATEEGKRAMLAAVNQRRAGHDPCGADAPGGGNP